MFKRAQAAMEFLMTYGWAILVVLAAIGALAYFGVLSPANLLPEKCEFPSGLTCTETASASAATGEVCFPVTNSLGYDVDTITVTVTNGVGCAAAAANPADILNGASDTLCFDGCTGPGTVSSGKKYSYDVEIGYRSVDTGISRAATGKISGKWAS